MKSTVLLIFALIFGLCNLYSQEACKDIIYTLEGNNIIFDCCIKDVKNGNIVSYTKEGDTLNIAASGITKDGQFIDLKKYLNPEENKEIPMAEYDGLYRGHDYAYYKYNRDRARNRQGIGIFLTILGLGLDIGGVITMNSSDDSSVQKRGANFIIAGAIFESVGIPLWISGGIKKNNNRNAMEERDEAMNLLSDLPIMVLV